MTRFKFLIGVVVVIGAAILWAVQHRAQVQLREENESLRQQLEQMTQIEADNERLSNLVAQANNQLPNEQFMELLKLRGEVGLLRQQTNGLQKLREQNQQLQTALATRNNSQNLQVTNLPPKAPPLAVYPKASWTFAGYATPEAAFQSLNWAAANGDLNALLDGSTPDQQKQFAEEFVNKSENDTADEIKNHISQNTEVSILSEDVHSDNQVILNILGDAEGNITPSHLVFQKIDGQWKYAGEDH
jgi:ABC-type transporter MlaC component